MTQRAAKHDPRAMIAMGRRYRRQTQEGLAEALQLAFSRGLVPADLTANMGLVRLHLERADVLTRNALDIAIADTRRYSDVYADSAFTDRGLVEPAA